MRGDKHFLLDEIAELMNRFDHFFVVRYGALRANLANQFRRTVMARGGDVHVMRKRILMKAADSLGIPLGQASLDGNIGLVFFAEDPVVMSKTLLQFAKENGDLLQLVGGHVEKRMCNAAEVSRLAELPSKQEMQAQLLGTLEAPMSQTLAVIEAIMSSVVYCLDNKIKQHEECSCG